MNLFLFFQHSSTGVKLESALNHRKTWVEVWIFKNKGSGSNTLREGAPSCSWNFWMQCCRYCWNQVFWGFARFQGIETPQFLDIAFLLQKHSHYLRWPVQISWNSLNFSSKKLILRDVPRLFISASTNIWNCPKWTPGALCLIAFKRHSQPDYCLISTQLILTNKHSSDLGALWIDSVVFATWLKYL